MTNYNDDFEEMIKNSGLEDLSNSVEDDESKVNVEIGGPQVLLSIDEVLEFMSLITSLSNAMANLTIDLFYHGDAPDWLNYRNSNIIRGIQLLFQEFLSQIDDEEEEEDD